MKEKILVTGGTGYIGSHTVVELQNAGYDVVIVDNLSNSSADVVDNIEAVSGIRPAFEKIDCLDYAGLEGVFAKYQGIKAIIHFAASKAVGESVQKPLLYYRNNIGSLINLLELMPKYGVEGIVFSSSCTVYGQPDVLPVTEKAPIKKAESPYGNTKQIQRGNHPRHRGFRLSHQCHPLALLQSDWRTSDSPAGRIAQWSAAEPCALHRADGHRHSRKAEHLRQRL